jgi:hypothetical protein
MPGGLIPRPTIGGLWWLVTLGCGHKKIWGADSGVPEPSDFPPIFDCAVHGQQSVTHAVRWTP